MRRLLLIVVLLALLTAVVTAPASASGYVEHIVDRGETLASIARHYHTTIYAILEANPSIWNPNYIWAGMRLQIPSGDYPPPHHPQPPHHGDHCSFYVVRYGDTLTGIAAWFGVDPWSIAQLNGIYNLNHIYAGMYLKIPCGGHDYPQPCYYHCDPHPVPPPYQNVISYTVLPGDNLTSIAYRYGTTVEEILLLNPIEIPYGNYLRRGQVIQVPVGPNPPGY